MSIPVTCPCGAVYTFKDELAGKLVRCSTCGDDLLVAATSPATQADPVFDRDQFLLRQNHLAIAEKYEVWDQEGKPILYIERPAHLGRNLLAAAGGIGAALVVGLFFGILAAFSPWESLKIILIVLAVLGAIVSLFVVGIALSQKRHISFYRDATKSVTVLEVLQDKKIQFLNATYTLRDPQGNVLAYFHKNYLYDIFRKRWDCQSTDGNLLCVAREDSVILALLRRLLGHFFGILRTNFLIFDGRSDAVLGEFNRKFTILDRYVLDLRQDPRRSLDRRVAVALGVLLDTGEKR